MTTDIYHDALARIWIRNPNNQVKIRLELSLMRPDLLMFDFDDFLWQIYYNENQLEILGTFADGEADDIYPILNNIIQNTNV